MSSRTKYVHSIKRKTKKLSPVTLVVIGLVIFGGAYSLAKTDVAYLAHSLVAAAGGAMDKSPRVEVTRSSMSPSSAIWPNELRTIAAFNVGLKNVKNANAYITKLPVDITINTGVSTLRVPQYSAKYSYCTSSECRSIGVPLTLQTTNNITYKLLFSGAVLPVYENPKEPALLQISALSYYPTYYHKSGSATASVKADVGVAEATMVATKGNKREPIVVDTKLAYGAWIPIKHTTGYGYGYFDYNNDGSLTEGADVSLLKEVVTYAKGCFLYKMCDVNKDGRISTADVDTLRQTVDTLSSAYPLVSLVSTSESADVGRSPDVGTFKIKYNVTAQGGTVYMLPYGSWYLHKNGEPAFGLGETGTWYDLSASDDTANGNYLIPEGQTHTFETTVSVSGKSPGNYRLVMNGVIWSSKDVNNQNLEDVKAAQREFTVDYKTNQVYLGAN